MQREKLGSRLGFILLSAGCAIGVGNVWKFPWMVGQNGGGMFVLVYLFFLIVMGIPVMTMEFAMGRASQKSPVRMYQELEPEGSKWHVHGYIAMIANYILMMFYTSVTGWMLKYFVDTARGAFAGASPERVGEIFGEMMGDPVSMMIYMTIVVVAGFLICSIGLQKGLERVTKVMMIALLAIMVVLAVRSIFLDGGMEGLEFYLKPDIEKMKKAGIGNVIVSAMNQSFFTLSLGIGSMAIFGSYIGKERSLMGEAVNVAVLDTFVAVTSGLIIFPACFAYNVPTDSGPNLIFVTLPNIFNNLPLGRVWGSLFFMFMSFAAFSTIFAVFENIISCTMDLKGWSRKKASMVNMALIFVLSIPCVLGFSVWSNIQPFGDRSTIMDIEDFIVSNILLPLGSILFIVFCTTRYGWGWKNFVTEANEGKGLKIKHTVKYYFVNKGNGIQSESKIVDRMRFYMTYILPVIIFILFVVGIVDKFN